MMKGDLLLKIMEKGKPKELIIKEGEVCSRPLCNHSLYSMTQILIFFFNHLVCVIYEEKDENFSLKVYIISHAQNMPISAFKMGFFRAQDMCTLMKIMYFTQSYCKKKTVNYRYVAYKKQTKNFCVIYT